MEIVASLSQGRTAAAQCGLFTYKSVPVIFEPPCTYANALVSPNFVAMTQTFAVQLGRNILFSVSPVHH